MQVRTAAVNLANDGKSGELFFLPFQNRKLHRLLAGVDEEKRPDTVRDVLDLGAEVLTRVGHHGDLEQLSQAVERLDLEGKRIVEAVEAKIEAIMQETTDGLAKSFAEKDGPLAAAFDQFDPTVEGNILNIFNDLIVGSIAKSTKQAVAELAEATTNQVKSLTESLTLLEKVAAVEEARLEEASRGTAKGLEHERNVETLLGELVGAAGDGLDDVSTIVGLAGNKQGDKVIRPKQGCSIVTEEKYTQRITESKARELLAGAMENRGAELGMLIVEDESKVPGNQPFHFIDTDKVVVVADRLTLRLVYSFMRGKAVERAQSAQQLDEERFVASLDAIRSHIAEMRLCLERFKLLRTEHTKATKAIGQAGRYVDELAETIANGVADITGLIDALVNVDQDEAA